MANYMEFDLMGRDQVKPRVKAGVIPHKFDCQGKQSAVNINRTASKRKRDIRDILASKENCSPQGMFPVFNFCDNWHIIMIQTEVQL